MMRANARRNCARTNSAKASFPKSSKPVARQNRMQTPLWGTTPFIQASLKVNAPNDKYEQEADRVASQVMRMPKTAVSGKRCACGKPMGPDGMCADCKRKQLEIQRQTVEGGGETAVSPTVQQTLSQPGRPLDNPTRNFMESRFGRDFGQVRVHINNAAVNSAESVNANAYTVGHNIVFNEGKYQPYSQNGRKLLAHELTHVVQQQSSSNRLQREGPSDKPSNKGASDQKIKRRDVVFVMDFEEAAKLASSGAMYIPVKSPQEMTDALKAITFPIGTIFIFSHSSNLAKIKFPDTGYVSASSLATTLKDSIQPEFVPQTIDFRGCSVGMNPAGMEEIRQATGASAVIGSTCFMVFKTLPFTVNNVHIKKKSQLEDAVNKATWDEHFKNHWKNFPSKDCVLDKGKNAYFRAGGYLVSIFANKDFTATYSPTESVCYKDLPETPITPKAALTHTPDNTKSCELIRVEASAPTATSTSSPAPEPQNELEETTEGR